MGLKKFFVIFGILLTLPVASHAMSWRGIVPLRSNCDDVKRILGISRCETRTYYFEHENAFISFADEPCDPRDKVGWNVPAGTVLSIFVNREPGLHFADLKLDESKFKKNSVEPDLTEYVDEEEGFVISVFKNGQVMQFFYAQQRRTTIRVVARQRILEALVHATTTAGFI